MWYSDLEVGLTAVGKALLGGESVGHRDLAFIEQSASTSVGAEGAAREGVTVPRRRSEFEIPAYRLRVCAVELRIFNPYKIRRKSTEAQSRIFNLSKQPVIRPRKITIHSRRPVIQASRRLQAADLKDRDLQITVCESYLNRFLKIRSTAIARV